MNGNGSGESLWADVIELGRGWHKFRFSVARHRWPTIRGENPPQGVPYVNVEASYGSRCIQVRLWNWRRREPRFVSFEPLPAESYCAHGYVMPWAEHPAAGLENCPKGCTDE